MLTGRKGPAAFQSRSLAIMVHTPRRPLRFSWGSHTIWKQADKHPSSTGMPAMTVPSSCPSVTEKGHFVVLELTSSDSSYGTQLPFQIDSAVFNTLPYSQISNMASARLLPTKTLIVSYASPPIKPVGQVILTASWGRFTRPLRSKTLTLINQYAGQQGSWNGNLKRWLHQKMLQQQTAPAHSGLTIKPTRSLLLVHLQPLRIHRNGYGPH